MKQSKSLNKITDNSENNHYEYIANTDWIIVYFQFLTVLLFQISNLYVRKVNPNSLFIHTLQTNLNAYIGTINYLILKHRG